MKKKNRKDREEKTIQEIMGGNILRVKEKVGLQIKSVKVKSPHLNTGSRHLLQLTPKQSPSFFPADSVPVWGRGSRQTTCASGNAHPFQPQGMDFNSSWRACSVPSVVSDSLHPHGLWPARLLCPWDSSRQECWRGCRSHLQRVFPTQGLNPHLL